MLANGRAPRHTSVQQRVRSRVCGRPLWRGLPISGRKPGKEVRYPDDLDASERHELEQVIISRHDCLRAGADGAFEHAVVVGIGRDGVDPPLWALGSPHLVGLASVARSALSRRIA